MAVVSNRLLAGACLCFILFALEMICTSDDSMNLEFKPRLTTGRWFHDFTFILFDA